MGVFPSDYVKICHRQPDKADEVTKDGLEIKSEFTSNIPKVNAKSQTQNGESEMNKGQSEENKPFDKFVNDISEEILDAMKEEGGPNNLNPFKMKRTEIEDTS